VCGRVISDYWVIYNVRSCSRPMEWTVSSRPSVAVQS